MKRCEHKTEKSSVVCSNMTTTVIQKNCADCGQIIGYRTEEIVPEIRKDEVIRAFRRSDTTDEFLTLKGRK